LAPDIGDIKATFLDVLRSPVSNVEKLPGAFGEKAFQALGSDDRGRKGMLLPPVLPLFGESIDTSNPANNEYPTVERPDEHSAFANSDAALGLNFGQ
jgi:hypothetical protein